MTNLNGSGTAAKYSAEAPADRLRGDAVLWRRGPTTSSQSTSATGKIVREYKAHLEQTISTVCCGWFSRGVANRRRQGLLGQLDGKLVVLDQKELARWRGRPPVGRWQDGVDADPIRAPLYYDGMVIVGGSGGEFSPRGRVAAFDAATGKLKWRFWTVPWRWRDLRRDVAQGQRGVEDGRRSGSGTPRPSILSGLLYFSTGNAAPDLNGSKREGDNLFTASIVAVDAETGKYRWHYQQVHHDIWDDDGPSPVVLFDVDGKKGLAQASKTGWLYLLDWETGEPLRQSSRRRCRSSRRRRPPIRSRP